jgi:hypothetical protein
MHKNPWIRRVAVGFAGFVLVLILSAGTLPFLVNVDQYRPQIVAAANEQLKGSLDVGPLSLSLWGQVEVRIGGLVLKDQNGDELLRADRVAAQIGFLSILSGRPLIHFRLDRAHVRLSKASDGRITVLGLLKNQAASQSRGGLLGLIRSAAVDVALKRATIDLVDASTKVAKTFSSVNINVENFSFSRPMKIGVWAEVSETSEEFSMEGPFSVAGVLTPMFEGGGLKSVSLVLDARLDAMRFVVPDVFEKSADVPFDLRTELIFGVDRVDMKNAKIRLHNAILASSGSLANTQSTDPKVQFHIESQSIDVSALGQLIPRWKQYDLSGVLTLHAKVQGTVTKLSYEAKVAITDFVASPPGLSSRPVMQVSADIVTDEIRDLRLDIQAPGTDVSVRAQLKSFTSPQLTMSVSAESLDMNQFLSMAPAPPAPRVDAPMSDAADDSDDVVNFDANFEPLRKSDLLAKSTAVIALRLKRLKMFDLSFAEFNLDATLKHLVASIDSFSTYLFRGLIKANASVDLSLPVPSYSMNISLSGVDLQTAVSKGVVSLDHTLSGQLAIKAQGTGSSFNANQMMRNLNLVGQVKVSDARFATIDVGKIAVEAVNQSIGDISKQIPAVQGQSLAEMKDFRSRYESIGGDFSFRSGVFTATSLSSVAVENEGIDVSGRVSADLLNDQIDAEWTINDTYHLSKARDLGIEIEGVSVRPLYARGKDPVAFPVKIGCKLSAPCYDYAAVAKHIGAIALENSRRAFKGSSAKSPKPKPKAQKPPKKK